MVLAVDLENGLVRWEEPCLLSREKTNGERKQSSLVLSL